MTLNGWLQILFFCALVLAVTKPRGVFMVCVFNHERTFLDPVLRPVERLIYRLTGVNEMHEMRWTAYAVAMLLFSIVSLLVLYLMQRVQYYLPLNPQKLAGIEPSSSFNTAVSFTTNTNWQSYIPETTMSYLDADGGHGVSQFHFRSGRHRAGYRVYSWHRTTRERYARQFLGRPDTLDPVGLASVLSRCW